MSTFKITKPGFYRLRNGKRQEIEVILSNGSAVGLVDKNANVWDSNGFCLSGGYSLFDIISEWTEPTIIPWTISDVPIGAVYSAFAGNAIHQGDTAYFPSTITLKGITFGSALITWTELATKYEYSTDLKTWKPCNKLTPIEQTSTG